MMIKTITNTKNKHYRKLLNVYILFHFQEGQDNNQYLDNQLETYGIFNSISNIFDKPDLNNADLNSDEHLSQKIFNKF